MTGPGLATDVGAVETEQLRLGSVTIRIAKNFTLIGSVAVGDLFLDPQEAARESGDLAMPLLKVSAQVAAQEQAIRAANPAATAEELAPSLTIAKDQSRDLLKELRRGGAALRASLTAECVDTLQAHGFPNANGGEPALTFAEQANVPHVLWDLVYDGGTTGAVQWESFWGFRVPMSHWIFATRPADLRLQKGVFGGFHEELPFAAREIAAVAQYVQVDGTCSTVADHFEGFVCDELVKRNFSAANAKAWIAERKGSWLEEFLSDDDFALDDADQWKIDKIVEMLQSTKPLHLLHFACHSQSTSVTASHAEITMKVGGETLMFDVATLMANVKDAKRPQTAPGPFVFLNACRSILTQQEFQPPPFATAWLQFCGAQAVISAVCPVPDFFAHAFALKYYDFLFGRADATFDGKPVKGSLAGALLATRRYFMETHANPLGLAYILYASEHTRLLGTRPGI